MLDLIMMKNHSTVPVFYPIIPRFFNRFNFIYCKFIRRLKARPNLWIGALPENSSNFLFQPCRRHGPFVCHRIPAIVLRNARNFFNTSTYRVSRWSTIEDANQRTPVDRCFSSLRIWRIERSFRSTVSSSNVRLVRWSFSFRDFTLQFSRSRGPYLIRTDVFYQPDGTKDRSNLSLVPFFRSSYLRSSAETVFSRSFLFIFGVLFFLFCSHRSVVGMAVLSDGFKRVSSTEIRTSTVSINSNLQYDVQKRRYSKFSQRSV